MKYWISLVNTTEVDQFVEIAKKAEELGFDGVSVPDHLIYPTNIETPYPYTADGKVWWPNTNPWPDPWVTLTAMGVATQRLRLSTNIYLAALRDPFTVARAVSGTAIFTNNRAIMGVSAGWLKEEFDLMGIEMKDRGRRLDEIIDCVNALNTGLPVSHHGEFFDYDDVILSPAPTKPVPVWVGGASKPALRRAANNDGWLGVPMTLKDLSTTISKLFELRRNNGKYELPFEVSITALEAITPDFLDSLDPAGQYFSNVLPWTPSPWGRAFWVKEGEDHTQLEVKFKAMERFKKMMQQMNIWQQD